MDLKVTMGAPAISRNGRHFTRKLPISLVIGLLIAICGSVPYYRAELVVGGRFDALFKVAAAMFMPGLLVAALLGGNVHDASLALGVVANWLLYGLSLFLILKEGRNDMHPGKKTYWPPMNADERR
jgi:hypothetical protein